MASTLTTEREAQPTDASLAWGSMADAYSSLENQLHCNNPPSGHSLPKNVISAAVEVTATFVRWICENHLFAKLTKNDSKHMIILDLATGPATLPIEIIRQLIVCKHVNPGHDLHTYELILTDIAPEMITISERILSATLQEIDELKAAISYRCQVLDASQPMNVVPPESVDIITCMFGIMFVPNHRAALQQHYKALKPSGGMAVYATWGNVDTMFIAEAFAVFSGIAPGTVYNAMKNTMRTGEDVEQFTKDLEDAGFEVIEIIQHREMFEIACNDKTIDRFVVRALLKNPIIKEFFEDMSEELLTIRWKEFMQSSHAARWSVNSGEAAQLIMNSNIYIAHTVKD